MKLCKEKFERETGLLCMGDNFGTYFESVQPDD
jgi:hypothetical protein